MNQPSTLRHSKSHRAVWTRQLSKQWVRYEITVGQALLGADARYFRDPHYIRDLINLPAGAVVRSQKIHEYDRAYSLVVDVPRTGRLAVHEAITVKCRGIVPAPSSGALAEMGMRYGATTAKQRVRWADEAEMPSKLSGFGKLRSAQ